MHASSRPPAPTKPLTTVAIRAGNSAVSTISVIVATFTTGTPGSIRPDEIPPLGASRRPKEGERSPYRSEGLLQCFRCCELSCRRQSPVLVEKVDERRESHLVLAVKRDGLRQRERGDSAAETRGRECLSAGRVPEHVKHSGGDCHRLLGDGVPKPADQLVLREVLLEGADPGKDSIPEGSARQFPVVGVQPGSHDENFLGQPPRVLDRRQPLCRILDDVHHVAEVDHGRLALLVRRVRRIPATRVEPKPKQLPHVSAAAAAVVEEGSSSGKEAVGKRQPDRARELSSTQGRPASVNHSRLRPRRQRQRPVPRRLPPTGDASTAGRRPPCAPGSRRARAAAGCGGA